jgi:hypothetical protein
MDSATYAKIIVKSKEYAQEPERVSFGKFEVEFKGKHQVYRVTFDHGQWHCECDFFAQRGICSHTMTLEKILGVMLEQHEPVVPEGVA